MHERMLAIEVSASSRYPFESLASIPVKPLYFTKMYLDVKKVLDETFFGPPNEGIYSLSVQATLYQMRKAVLGRFPDVSFIQLKMPNIHFLPVTLSSKDNPVIVKILSIMYNVEGSRILAREMDSLLAASNFMHPLPAADYFSKIKETVHSETYNYMNNHSSLQPQSSNLTRYQSVPSSFLESLVNDIVVADDYLSSNLET